MENNVQEPMVTPAHTTSRGSKAAWVLVALFVLTTVAGAGLYLNTKKQKDAVQTQLASEQAKLRVAEEKIKQGVFFPEGDTFQPLCGSNNDTTRLAQINTEPVNGYDLYIVNCLQGVLSQNFSKIQVIGFKTEGQEKPAFAFGVGQGEQFCVPGTSILPAEDATAISKATGLPLCKS